MEFFKRSNGIDSGSLVESMPPLAASKFDFAWDYFQYAKDIYYLQEICITFSPRYHKMPALYLYSTTKDRIRKWFSSWHHFEPLYIFVPEFNEAGVLHYHGLVHFVKEHEYLCAETKNKFNKIFGRTRGKEVYNLDNYSEYMKKDISKQYWQITPFTNIPNPEKKEEPFDIGPLEMKPIVEELKKEVKKSLLIDMDELDC